MDSSDRSPVLEFSEVSYHDPRFPGPLLEHIDFSLAPGEALALVGPAGSGKSTAIGLALGACRPGSGEVLAMGRSPLSMDPAELVQLRARIGYVAQHGALLGNLSLLDNLALPLRWHRNTDEAQTTAQLASACAALELDLDEVPRVQPAMASAEMRHLVALAKALVLDPVLLILDEPAFSLSGNAAREYWRLLAQLRQRRRIALLIATSDASTSSKAVDQVISLPPRVEHVRVRE
jgi:ABC-type transporter Mla maintaining outer membrane lipid asymmetry ATPase subunit MlaF